MRKRRRCLFLGSAILFCSVTIYFPLLLTIRPEEEVEIWNITRNMQVFVRPNDHTSIIPAEHFCRRKSSGSGEAGTEDDDVFLLIVVCSGASNFEARQTIRQTWGNPENLKSLPKIKIGTNPKATNKSVATGQKLSEANPSNVTVKVLFMLGRIENSTLQESILDESERQRDVVQEDFLDTYNNLTLKSAMMLKWVNSTCKRVRYLMKTDDDSFVNVPRLVEHLKAHGRPNLLLGCLICGALPVRNKQSKWYSPRNLYGERYYPSYLSGTGYVMSHDLISRLYRVVLVTPFFHLEDVYVTGICAKRLKVKPVDHEGFTYQKRKQNSCLFHLIFTAHQMKPADMKSIWKDMSANITCDAKRIRLRSFRSPKC